MQTPGILKKLDPRRRRSRVNPDGTMSLVEHLHELRNRLLIAVAAIVVTTTARLLLVQPRRSSGCPAWATGCAGRTARCPRRRAPTIAPDGACRLLATAPFDQFMLRLKVALTAGIVLACPVWLYQLWAFITPGLYARNAASRSRSSASARCCSSPARCWPTWCCRRRCTSC